MLTENQHTKAAELSADVLKRRRELDDMQMAIDELAEKIKMAKECRARASSEYLNQLAVLNDLLVQGVQE